MIKKEIEKLIKDSLVSLLRQKKLPKFDVPKILVEQPKEKKYGDWTTNIAMVIAKDLKKSPMEIANLLSDDIEKNMLDGKIGEKRSQKTKKIFDKVEVVSPGFVNFFLSQKILFSELKSILKKKEDYGRGNIGGGKTIVIDYSSVNIAKPFSVGHLRSTIIGQAIYNLYSFLGYKTIGDNHIGDWGTQFGKLICAIKKWGDEKEISKNPIKNLFSLYVKFHSEADKNTELEKEGRMWFKRLENKDKEAIRLWKKCVSWSLKEFKKIYKELGIEIDLTLGESFYEPMLKGIVKELLDKKIAVKSEGAIVVFFPNNILPPLMIKKSDGTTLYSTRDLAAIKYRRKKFKPYKIIYEVGADQALYFKQLFWTAELLGWGKRSDYVHISHGMMRLATGRMRTRQGKVILLNDLLKKAFEMAKKMIKEKNKKINLKDRKKIAKIISIAAIKYNNLFMKPSTNIVFDWKTALSLNGNSGPYLQYTYARAKSIIRKSKIYLVENSTGKKKKKEGSIYDLIKKIRFSEELLKKDSEILLLRKLIEFPEIIEKAAENYSPNIVCNYIFELSQKFNSFYETVSVLKEEDDKKRIVRLSLVDATAQVIKNGLNLLGIETLEEM